MNGTQARPLSTQITLSFGKPLGDAVDDPVGQVDHVEVAERDRVHRDEAVDLLHQLVAPVEAGVERQRLARRLQRGIEPHVAVVMHRLVAGRDHGEADDARLVGELLDHLDAGVGIVERQIHHRLDARLPRQQFLDHPAIERAPERHLHLGLRMHAEQQHRRRERHRVVDAHAVHRAPDQLDLTMRAFADDRVSPAARAGCGRTCPDTACRAATFSRPGGEPPRSLNDCAAWRR